MARHIDKLHPDFAAYARDVLVHVAQLCLQAGVSWYVASSYRTPARQWEIYKKGRKKVGIDYVRIPGQKIFTRALPHQTPHCVTLDKKPASCALDIALTHTGPSGRLEWLPDHDPRWCIVGTSVGIVSHQKLTWGGSWHSIRDMPHVELKDWRDLETDDLTP